MTIYISKQLFDTWYFIYHTHDDPSSIYHLFRMVGIYHYGG